MLHDTKEIDNKDGSITVKTSLFVNRNVVPDLNLSGAAVKSSVVPGGQNPGPDAEILVEVTLPKKAVQAEAAKPAAPPAPPAPVV